MERRRATFGSKLAKVVIAAVLGLVCLTSVGCAQLLRIVGSGDTGVVRSIGNSSESSEETGEAVRSHANPW